MSSEESQTKNSGGGRANSGGVDYQSRIAAYFCVKILAEREIPPAWDLSLNEALETLEAETKNEIDDLLIRTSNNRKIFINAKHKLSNTSSETSELGKAINQLVNQFLKTLESNSQEDRLLLITSSNSSETIKVHLKNLLSRLHKSNSDQTLETIIRNEKEQDVLTNIKNHIVNFWSKLTNSYPTEGQIKNFLQAAWLEILDVDEGEIHEKDAKTWLNSLILQDNKAESAWNNLGFHCLTLNKLGGSADRRTLQNTLLKSGFCLKHTKSYREDIEKLKTLTRKTLQSLRNLSIIQVRQTEIKIKRPVKDALILAAESKSLVVTGEPGSGKSGVLYEFVVDLMTKNRDVIFLAVDKIESNKKVSFYQELRLENDFQDVLENWIGNEQAFLVIDALDASRDQQKAKFINNLIEEVIQNNKRWKIIVSVRKFELRYNAKLQNLFTGHFENDYRLPEFSNICHFNIPKLNIDEWLQIPQQCFDFGTLFLQASNELREMLFIPFNLRLLGELIGEGIAINELSPIRTQIELLERYWKVRVIGSDFEGDKRESILAKAVRIMVEKRQMQVNRQEIIEFTNGNSLNEIFSQNILTEWQISETRAERNILTFSHHVLYDYAVARLFLRTTEDLFIKKLESDSELVLAIRPSIQLHFHYELLKDKIIFWQLVFNVIKTEDIPEIGKLIGTSVAVSSAADLEFFNPFFELLNSDNLEKRKIGEKTLIHLIRELKVKVVESLSFIFLDGNQLWTSFLEKLSNNLTPLIAHNLRYLIWSFINRVDNLTDEQIFTLGVIARRLLEFSFSSSKYDSLLAHDSIGFICQTFESDKEESAKILTRVLESQHVAEYGHDELHIFENHIEKLSVLDPILVEEIYRAAFTNFDYSEEKTSMSHSRILNLTSTRKQDFKLMRYALKNKFGKFLRQSPIYAVRALVDAINGFVEEEYVSRFERRKKWTILREYDENETPVIETFTFDNKEVSFVTDFSEWWDNGSNYRDAESLEMLEIFTNYFESLFNDEENKVLRNNIVTVILEKNQNAVFWRKLINCGTKFPDSFGQTLHSLAWTSTILLSRDTSTNIGSYLQTNFANFSELEREQTERAILSIPNVGTNEDEKQYLLFDRNRLLGCLDLELIVTDEAREVLEDLKKQEIVPSNNHRFGSHNFTQSVYTEDEELQDKGVSLEEEANLFIKNLYKPIESFASTFQNTSPTLSEVKNILPHLQQLYEVLTNSQNSEGHKLILDYAWGHLASACAKSVEANDLESDVETLDFLTTMLMAASTHSIPEVNENSEKNFSSFPSWSFPFVRGDAAEGLVRLARFKAGASDKVLDKIEELALNDVVPSVRYHVCIRINSLCETATELMWKILDKVCQEENNLVILTWLTSGCLRTLAYHNPEKIFELTRVIYERLTEGEKISEIKKNCTFIFGILAFQFKHSESWSLLEKFIGKPDLHNSEVFQIVMNAGESLNYGISEITDKKKSYIRLECFRVLEQICRNSWIAFQNLLTRLENRDSDEWAEDEIAEYKLFHQLIDFIATKVYFASGGAERIEKQKDKVPMGDKERLQFWREAEGVLNEIAETRFSDVTHRLVETLDFLFSYEPKGVFLLLGKAVRNGKADNYQYESMAVSNIIKIVERVLSSQYAYLLKESVDCRQTIIEILDTFVEAGWDEAHRLTYRLEEIYR